MGGRKSSVIRAVFGANNVIIKSFYKTKLIGEHGLIVSLGQTRIAWATGDAVSVVTDANDDDNGATNMATIAKLADWKTNFPPFAWVAAKITYGVSGWILPAYEQIEALYFA